MIINGMGGTELTVQHAINSAKILNETQPRYASTLVLTAYKSMEYLISRLDGNFTELDSLALVKEMKLFVENTNLEETIFRSDHASNFLVLKGILGRDKDDFLEKIEQILKSV